MHPLTEPTEVKLSQETTRQRSVECGSRGANGRYSAFTNWLIGEHHPWKIFRQFLALQKCVSSLSIITLKEPFLSLGSSWKYLPLMLRNWEFRESRDFAHFVYQCIPRLRIWYLSINPYIIYLLNKWNRNIAYKYLMVTLHIASHSLSGVCFSSCLPWPKTAAVAPWDFAALPSKEIVLWSWHNSTLHSYSYCGSGSFSSSEHNCLDRKSVV